MIIIFLFVTLHDSKFIRREIVERVYNFSAGPSALPVEVLETAQKEMLCYGDTGMSVMEMSHRSAAFADILAQTKADYKELMQVPDNYSCKAVVRRSSR
jgi:phosphoserine aminotransferase